MNVVKIRILRCICNKKNKYIIKNKEVHTKLGASPIEEKMRNRTFGGKKKPWKCLVQNVREY